MTFDVAVRPAAELGNSDATDAEKRVSSGGDLVRDAWGFPLADSERAVDWT
jgi:hypothetical protein